MTGRGLAGATPARARRLAAFLLILGVQFGLFETALRLWGHSEAAPAFQGLFADGETGYRLKPNARVRFTTSEFDTQIDVNASGFRDDQELGPKGPNEKRIVLLGDSLVLAVQVPFEQTFGELLERRLNARGGRDHYRVINAGVQGYGPVEELLLFKSVVSTLQPDLVIVTVFVGNDAEEAARSASRMNGATASVDAAVDTVSTRLRRLIRRSMVLQLLRLRVVSATDRYRGAFNVPEPPLQSYAEHPAPRIAEGLAVTRACVQQIAEAASAAGARTAVALMPARFQVDDADYGRFVDIVKSAGGSFQRDAASQRFDAAFADLPIPRVDLLPSLRSALPGPDLFFQLTVHLTPRGHVVVADALDRFIDAHDLLAPAGQHPSR